VRLPPLDWWRTVFYLIPTLAAFTIVCGTASLFSTFVDRTGHRAHRWAQRWARLIVETTGLRVELTGASLPAEHDSCIFVANHASFYDIPVVFTAVPRQLRIMAKAALRFVPFIGWHLLRGGHVLVNRAKPGAAILKRMQRMTGQNASLIFFPEGSRTRDGQVQEFKGGVFLLAIESRLPVVPLTVVGNHTVMPRGRLMVRPTPVRVVVHDAISTADLSRKDARALAERVQAIVASGLNG
jgi:1-acyl-sn-glycerol-3-phosphate acyltransferase